MENYESFWKGWQLRWLMYFRGLTRLSQKNVPLLKQTSSCVSVSTLLDLKSVKSVQNQWRWCDEANNNPIMLRGVTVTLLILIPGLGHSRSLDSVSTFNSPRGSWQAMTSPPPRSFQWSPNIANSWWHSTVVPRLLPSAGPSEDTCYSGPVGLSQPPRHHTSNLSIYQDTSFLLSCWTAGMFVDYIWSHLREKLFEV